MRSKYPRTIELWGHTWTKPRGQAVWLGPAITDPEDPILALSVEYERIVRRDGRYVMLDPGLTLDRFGWEDGDITITDPDTERFERSERPERSRPVASLPPSSPPARQDPKAALLSRLRTMQAEGLSLQKIAERLNNEGVRTLSGKGRWQKGTIGNLLAQGEDA